MNYNLKILNSSAFMDDYMSVLSDREKKKKSRKNCKSSKFETNSKHIEFYALNH